MTNKFNARSITVDGIRFDSQAEARRYQELVLIQRAEEIQLLEVHPRFEILPGFMAWDGKRIRPTYYEGDFQYWDCHKGRMVIEDVKAWDVKNQKFLVTPLCALKIKMFKFIYPQFDFEFVRG